MELNYQSLFEGFTIVLSIFSIFVYTILFGSSLVGLIISTTPCYKGLSWVAIGVCLSMLISTFLGLISIVVMKGYFGFDYGGGGYLLIFIPAVTLLCFLGWLRAQATPSPSRLLDRKALC